MSGLFLIVDMAIMDTVISIAVFLVLIGILVVTHEWGHYIVARKCGVGVKEFAFGLPPKLWSRKRGETEFVINALPIGGYVRLVGEDESEDGPDSFQTKTPWQRLAVLFAGSAVHFVMAFVIFSAMIMIMGKAVPNDQVMILSVAPGSPAEQAGLVAGDEIVTLEGLAISSVEGFSEAVNAQEQSAAEIAVLRDGETIMLHVSPERDPASGRDVVGVTIAPGFDNVPVYPWQAIVDGAVMTGTVVMGTMDAIGGLFAGLLTTGQVSEDISGPVGIAAVSGSVVQEEGLFGFFFLMALLAANLAVFNLLPIPALDGGRILFVLAEIVIRRRVPAEREAMVHMVGMVMLLMLIVVVTYKDIMSLFS